MAEHRFATMADTGEIARYSNNPGTYQFGAEPLIAKMVERNFQYLSQDKVTTTHFVKEVTARIQRRTYVKREMFDRDPFIFNLENGLLDIRTCELKEHTPDHLSLVQIPIRYDPAADCPAWKQFLSQVHFSQDIDVAQELFGACLWREPIIQKIIILWGTGGNGKSKWLAVLKTLLGAVNVSACSLQELETNKFAKADVAGKLANLYADLPDKALASTGTIKTLTGGDAIMVEKKYGQRYQTVPYAKMIFSCNKIPEVKDDTTAFFRRLIILTFPNTFEGDQDNKEILKQLTTPAELSGILNWALEGLQRLRKNHWNFSYSKGMEEVRVDFTRKSDPVKAFIMDCCILESAANVVKKTLYNAYLEYCRDKKLPGLTTDGFYKSLPLKADRPLESSQLTIIGKRVWHFVGIALKPREKWGTGDEEKDEAEPGQNEL